MHQGNIFMSFSSCSDDDEDDEDDDDEDDDDDEEENRRSVEKLRAVQSHGRHPLVPIEEEEGCNMLSEMFNSHGPGPADFLATAAAAHETSTNPPAGYGHRMMIQQQQMRPADFYGSNNRPQGLASTNNWSSSSSSVLIIDDREDHVAALAAAKQHGLKSAANHQNSDPDHQSSPMGPGTLLHHQQHHHDEHDQRQAFLGGGDGAASIFGEGVSFGGGITRERLQAAGPSLSLSNSSLQQLRGVRPQSAGSAAACSLLFYNMSQQQQEQQLHTTGIHQQPPSSCHQSQAAHEYDQLLHMSTSYGSVSTANVLRNSKYARAAQELLEEFCSVSRGHVRGGMINTTGRMIRTSSSINPNLLISHGGRGVSSSTAAASSSSSKADMPPALSPADRFENQRKKSKLLSMLDEVEKRYNHYCEQMQMVVNSFDSVMGFGAAMPYTALARKAMSRHFRCLKDAITVQLKQACELLGDNDGGSGSGLTKGETPKLRLIDQNLRQQRAFHQMGMMEQEAWRPQRGLPDRSVSILRSWLFEHFLHPYPSDADKHLLARKTGLSRNQVSNWFINARVRLWKPMVEDMYQQEAKEEEDEETLLAAAPTGQQQQPCHSPESDAPSRPPLEHYGQPAPPPPLDDPMYRRAAATASARTGDLSLTLGLRHAGGNAPDAVARFGL